MQNILVTLDFNKNEHILMEKVLEMARALHAKVWLLHVADPEPEFVGFGVGPQYVRNSMAEELRKEHRLLEEHSRQFKKEGITCHGILIKGPTIEMILQEAKKLAIDMIITGHREHSFLYKAFFGNVASGVIKKANIPVLIVPLPDE